MPKITAKGKPLFFQLKLETQIYVQPQCILCHRMTIRAHRCKETLSPMYASAFR